MTCQVLKTVAAHHPSYQKVLAHKIMHLHDLQEHRCINIRADNDFLSKGEPRYSDVSLGENTYAKVLGILEVVCADSSTVIELFVRLYDHVRHKRKRSAQEQVLLGDFPAANVHATLERPHLKWSVDPSCQYGWFDIVEVESVNFSACICPDFTAEGERFFVHEDIL